MLQDDGQVVCLKKELSPSMTDPLQDLATYTVDVYTSQLPASGTEGNVYVELVGSKGSTGKACTAVSRSTTDIGHLCLHMAKHLKSTRQVHTAPCCCNQRARSFLALTWAASEEPGFEAGPGITSTQMHTCRSPLRRKLG